jgi:hypothetical protein
MPRSGRSKNNDPQSRGGSRGQSRDAGHHTHHNEQGHKQGGRKKKERSKPGNDFRNELANTAKIASNGPRIPHTNSFDKLAQQSQNLIEGLKVTQDKYFRNYQIDMKYIELQYNRLTTSDLSESTTNLNTHLSSLDKESTIKELGEKYQEIKRLLELNKQYVKSLIGMNEGGDVLQQATNRLEAERAINTYTMNPQNAQKLLTFYNCKTKLLEQYNDDINMILTRNHVCVQYHREYFIKMATKLVSQEAHNTTVSAFVSEHGSVQYKTPLMGSVAGGSVAGESQEDSMYSLNMGDQSRCASLRYL